MQKLLRGSVRTLVLAVVGMVACGSSVEPGVNCKSKDDCGSLTCFCYSDPIPGTCSQSCATDADCKSLGGDYTCRDFGDKARCGSEVKICLRGGGAG